MSWSDRRPPPPRPAIFDTLGYIPELFFGYDEDFENRFNRVITQEDNFHSRPSIKIVLPDHLKGILVDDWENITKNQQLVPLPHQHPVNEILRDYLDYVRPNRVAGTASAGILEEVVLGLREYMDKCLGRILLYRFVQAAPGSSAHGSFRPKRSLQI